MFEHFFGILIDFYNKAIKRSIHYNSCCFSLSLSLRHVSWHILVIMFSFRSVVSHSSGLSVCISAWFSKKKNEEKTSPGGEDEGGGGGVETWSGRYVGELFIPWHTQREKYIEQKLSKV